MTKDAEAVIPPTLAALPADPQRLMIVDVVVAVLTLASLVLAVNQVFNLGFFMRVTILQSSYLYFLASVFLCIVFLVFPARRGEALLRPPGPLDILLAITVFGCGLYFAATGMRSLNEGWEYSAPFTAKVVSFLFWLLILETTRRTGGLVLFIIVLAFSLYPVVAGSMPGPISGFSQPLSDVVPFHILSSESSFGIPMNAFGGLVLGFVLFGAALQHTGGGTFFNNIAFALLGGVRGGAAKVACLGSGLMGSVSGSVISNIMSTGAVSIPAMKRTGFSAPQAAGVEACASTGGVLMPPVMGATAFVMASFLGVSYSTIIVAAIVPSALYFFGLMVQIDAYAARRNLAGLPRSELPSLRQTFKDGWHYIAVFIFLIVLLVGYRLDSIAPYLATAALLFINQIVPRTRLGWKAFIVLLAQTGRALAEMAAILTGVGLIVGAFSVTGLAGVLANDLVFLAGGSQLALLAMGALTAFIFGMGMTVTSCYVFLAVILAPALVRTGLDPLSVHLFIMYWGMVSFITPPVALGAFTAASLAQTSAMKAGFSAMRLGSVIYFIPFLFVLEPALIAQGEPMELLVTIPLAFAGVWLFASALQGYLVGFGTLGGGSAGVAARVLLGLAGMVVACPASVVPEVSGLLLLIVGVLLSGLAMFLVATARVVR